MTLARKLWIGFGVFFLILIVTSLIIDGHIRGISSNLNEITAVEEATSAAAYEMEINVIGTGMGVLQYLATGDPQFRQRVVKDEADFERFKAQYDRLAETQKGKELGTQIGLLYEKYKVLGEILMNEGEGRGERSAETGERLEKIDSGGVYQLRYQQNLKEFSNLREQLDYILDEEIQALTTSDLEGANADAQQTVRNIRLTILVMLGIGLLVGSGAAVISSGGIVKSVSNLVEGVEKVGCGALDHQIEVTTSDEIGHLTLAFNRMTENRRGTQERLRLLESAVQQADESIIITTAELDLPGPQIIFVNPAFTRMTGYTSEEAVGRTPRILQGPQTDRRVLDRVRRNLSRGQLFRGDTINYRKDGTEYRQEWHVAPVRNESGEVTHFLSIQRDITARWESEDEVRAQQEFLGEILDINPNMIFAKDRDGRYTLANKAMADMYGTTAEDLTGKTDADFNGNKEQVERFLLDDREVMETSRNKFVPEESFTNARTGEVQWFQTTKIPITSPDGKVSQVLGVATDITERRRLEAQLRQSHKLKSIGQLAAGIAHEINTPTQYVGDNTRFLQDAFPDLTRVMEKSDQLLAAYQSGTITPELVAEMEQVTEQADVEYLMAEIPRAIQQSLDGVERIAKIVQSMKYFAHPGSTGKKAADINKAIESAITVAANEWKYIAEMQTNLDQTLPLIPCLLGEFNQVILNMVINAAHAVADVVGDGSSGKGQITVSTTREDDWAVLRISDTGAGIPVEVRSRIFDPFFTTKEVGKGTGQGLAISHTVIVEKHGGTISFETEIGRGTTFIIRLPLHEAVTQQSEKRVA